MNEYGKTGHGEGRIMGSLVPHAYSICNFNILSVSWALQPPSST